MSQAEKSKAIRTITLEEHYASPAFMEGPGRQLKGYCPSRWWIIQTTSANLLFGRFFRLWAIRIGSFTLE